MQVGGLDAFSLREVFLSIRTPVEALDFFTVSGPFRDRDRKGELHTSLTWDDFQRWQRLICIVITKGILPRESIETAPRTFARRFAVPDDLRPLLSEMSVRENRALTMFPSQINIRTNDGDASDRRPFLWVEIIVNSLLEAVLATIYVDNLRGANYRLCALVDCSKVFEAKLKRKEYCCHDCAHKALVRRGRAEKEKAAKNRLNTSKSSSKPIKKGK
jgi:hypothetical protein